VPDLPRTSGRCHGIERRALRCISGREPPRRRDASDSAHRSVTRSGAPTLGFLPVCRYGRAVATSTHSAPRTDGSLVNEESTALNASEEASHRQVLGERYWLFLRLSEEVDGGGPSQTWQALDGDDQPYLVRLWPFHGDTPDDVQRALWDAELRTLYRIGSSPGAEESLVTLREAGVDRERKCFVMVSSTPGYKTLGDLLTRRASIPELADPSPRARRDVWRALERLAQGLRLLHEQNVLHRNVSAETILIDDEVGLRSMRLDGFEWSVRLGAPAHAVAPVSWATPPERFEGRGGFRPEHDWFGFGTVAARVLLDLNNYRANAPEARFERTVRAIGEATRQLSEIERQLLLRLLALDPRERLVRAEEVIAHIRDLIRDLDSGVEPADDAPLILAIDPQQQSLVDAAREHGFNPDPEDPLRPFSALDPEHVARLCSFLRDDLRGGQLHVVARRAYHILVGSQLALRIGQFRVVDRGTGIESESWQAAHCRGPADELRVPEHAAAASVDLPSARLLVSDVKTVRRQPTLRQRAQSWETIVPVVDRGARLRADLGRFHDFVRCTNQIELLMRDAELFGYRVVERKRRHGFERLVVEEHQRVERPPLDFARTRGLAQFLEQERETGKRRADLVILTPPHEDSLSLNRVEEHEHWKIDGDAGTATLERAVAGVAPAPDTGILRTHGMFGQVRLIRRRKKAIDRLNRHAYLLRSLSEPGQVYMDTGDARLGVHLPEDAVDGPKRAAIEDILRVRPIYSLQGPPGTGKTTLVAWLVREILADDPVAQILVTAQAHGAVDVLKDKVATEAFEGLAEEQKPLAVRLRRDDDLDDVELLGPPDADSVDGVALRILETACARLPEPPEANALQQAWREAAEEMIAMLRTRGAMASTPDFCELVKRGCHLIYCTTSAGELEAIADMTMSFDWSILEEAGKAHGFDLALPLHAGHRWLLIGDQYQLPPYRYDDYLEAVGNLEAVTRALLELPERGAGLVDYDWLLSFRDRSLEERAAFARFVEGWLKTFARVFQECGTAPSGQVQLTAGEPNGSAAGRITGQHRMHPTIGQLISRTFYRSELTNETERNGVPREDVVHPFTAPAGIARRAIVWLDLPAAADGGPREIGPESGRPRYTNPAEAKALAAFFAELRQPSGGTPLDVAVLSPYNRQVALLRRELRDSIPSDLELKATRRRGPSSNAEIAHSVDSFQGNQAKIIAVSLVRNNTQPRGSGLGFLEDAERMNVLLSRAEALLVLVGSFDFFQHQVSLVDPDDRNHPLQHLRTATDLLEQWFTHGSAMRLAGKWR
jgi:hypothetical protein